MGAGKTVVLTMAVNPALVGGLTVQIGDKFLDLSIATKVSSIKVCVCVFYPRSVPCVFIGFFSFFIPLLGKKNLVLVCSCCDTSAIERLKLLTY